MHVKNRQNLQSSASRVDENTMTAQLQARPDHFALRHLLGVIAIQKKNLLTAVELIGKAIKIFPHNPAFYSKQGNALQEMKGLSEATDSNERTIVLRPQ